MKIKDDSHDNKMDEVISVEREIDKSLFIDALKEAQLLQADYLQITDGEAINYGIDLILDKQYLRAVIKHQKIIIEKLKNQIK